MSLNELRSVLEEQIECYRRLRETGRASRRAHRRRDAEAGECILAEQVTTLRELEELRRARHRLRREVVGDGETAWPLRD